ncbi:MAG: potassium channel family protein [Cyanobacteriota bacterium]
MMRLFAGVRPRLHPQDLRQQRRELRRQHQLNIAAVEHHLVLFLIVSLLPVLVLPWADSQGNPLERMVLPGTMSLLILQSLWTLPRFDNRPVAGAVARTFQVLGLIALVGCWLLVLPGLADQPGVRVLVMALLAAFLTFSAVRLVQLLARVPRVNLQVLAGAAGGYVHLGLTGGVIATMMQHHDPSSFSLGHMAGHETVLERLLYFSYITVSTLGYGDVLPTNVFGERFVVLLGLCSTMYVSLLVALLLGRFVSPPEPGAFSADELEDALHELRNRR